MIVYVACQKKFIRKLQSFETRVRYVFDDHEVAEDFLALKDAQGDYNWVILKKQIRKNPIIRDTSIPFPKEQKKPNPLINDLSWIDA